MVDESNWKSRSGRTMVDESNWKSRSGCAVMDELGAGLGELWWMSRTGRVGLVEL